MLNKKVYLIYKFPNQVRMVKAKPFTLQPQSLLLSLLVKEVDL